MKRLALLFLVACSSSPPPCPQAPPCPTVAAPVAVAPPALTSARDVALAIVERINARDAAGVIAHYGPAMKEALPENKTRGMIEQVLAAKGKLGGLAAIAGEDNVFALEAERGVWRLEIHVDKDGKVLGMRLSEPPPPEPAITKATVALPFKGKWLVFWGGATPETNHHIGHKSQRRAADLVMVGEDGKTSYKNDGKKNEDYFAYGKEILAAEAGEVTTVIDGVPDNVPGAMNRYVAPGNLVILKHAEKLFSAYAHLQPGKIKVKVGAKVKKGDVLGLCGNSGNSSEPHLHFQLQDGPLFEDSWGIEAVFPKVTKGGATVSDYVFAKGDLVAP